MIKKYFLINKITILFVFSFFILYNNTKDKNKKSTLLYHPLKKGSFTISSHYGKRFNSQKGKIEFHGGVDFAALKGTPIYAAHQGKVIETSFKKKGFGKSIVLCDEKSIQTRYAHLSKIVVKKGETICSGQKIGEVGATGNVRGKNPYHLHFEVIAQGKKQNPLKYL